MSGSLLKQISSPTQAADIYSQTNAFPKQRHVFLVRFTKRSSQGASSSVGVNHPSAQMTYVVKSFDRPNIELISEEVNQYNKKRIVYTGYKKSPVKCSFYDDAASSAQQMFAEYSRYYFGDFALGNDAVGGAFSDDIIYPWIDKGSDFGFTAKNGGNRGANSQWYFASISILHFHNQIYDLYTLVNPRITSFIPDSLDFESSALSMIDVSFSYEALVFQPNYNDKAANQSEFTGLFNGHTDGTQVDQQTANSTATTPAVASSASPTPVGIPVYGSGGTQTLSSQPNTPDYRYYGGSSSGALGAFGSFVFGSQNATPTTTAVNTALGQLALNNPTIASTLGVILAGTGSPSSVNSVLGSGNSPTSVPSQLSSVLSGILGSVGTGNYGNIGQQIAQGVLLSNLTSGGNNNFNQTNGLTLSSQAIGAINATLSGSAQYGYNPNTTPAGTLYGYQGSGGLSVPPTIGAITTPAQSLGVATQTNPSAQIIAAVTSTVAASSSSSATPLPAVSNPNASPDDSDPFAADSTDLQSGVDIADG